MIPRTRSTWQSAWQQALAAAVRDPAELCALLELQPDALPAMLSAARPFSLRAPRGYVARMRKGDPNDPLLLQVLPTAAELEVTPGFAADPVGDLQAMPLRGVLHKYRERVLLVTTGACAVHCRYCFRRHFPYSEANAATEEWSGAIDYIAADTSIHEVILSGGDPLMLADDRLSRLAERLAAIPHLRRLRLHSRLPVVLPERVTDELLAWLSGSRLQPVLVIHANHAQEIDSSVRAALARLRARNVMLLNQSVLLRAVNDSTDALADLSEVLFGAGVQPYYLHQLDRVQGAAHFEVPPARGRELIRGLRERLPGYLIPTLVEEQPGAPSKSPL